nr:unnamed protein product [Digitaria exilis]
MGAPKQRWTPEEEAALKAGVAKHGPGKWRTILRDPDFSLLLRLRSNVDLKDKWRNLSVTAGGYGSREKARMALKKGRRVVPKLTAEPMDVDVNGVDNVHDTVIDAEPLAMVVEPLALEESPEKSVARLDDLILEAIRKRKEPSGSNKVAIAAYIELTKPQVDAELEKMKVMTKEEAAAFAAKAVAEAELAIAEAEEAARVAEAAENDAEAAKAFLEAVTLSVRDRNAASTVE